MLPPFADLNANSYFSFYKRDGMYLKVFVGVLLGLSLLDSVCNITYVSALKLRAYQPSSLSGSSMHSYLHFAVVRNFGDSAAPTPPYFYVSASPAKHSRVVP